MSRRTPRGPGGHREVRGEKPSCPGQLEALHLCHFLVATRKTAKPAEGPSLFFQQGPLLLGNCPRYVESGRPGSYSAPSSRLDPRALRRASANHRRAPAVGHAKVRGPRREVFHRSLPFHLGAMGHRRKTNMGSGVC